MFQLHLYISDFTIKALKASLRSEFPELKPTLLIEAAARGFGFKTYAAMRASVIEQPNKRVSVYADRFRAYIADQNTGIDRTNFYRAVAKTAIQAVLEKESSLCAWGIFNGRPQRNENGKRETAAEQHQRFKTQREELAEGCADGFLLAFSLVQRIRKTKTFRSESGSYRLKHIAENFRSAYPGGEKLGPHYVSNGALIAAAIHDGFVFKTFKDDHGYDSVNVIFNMSKTCIDDLDCEIRPDSAMAESRKQLARERDRRRLGFSI